MRKIWIMAAAFLALVAVVALAVLNGRPATASDNDIANANLPIVLKPENTPTPTPTATPIIMCTPPACGSGGILVCPSGDCPGGCGVVCVQPTPYATLVPNPSPTPGFGPNFLRNGSFEGGWTDEAPVDGYLINQEPKEWDLTWLEKGETVWDLRTMNPAHPNIGVVTGIAEMLHKLKNQLPPHEQPGGPNALILEGNTVYKIFHRAGVFGSQLYQEVTLPAGNWRLTVPVQLHWHESLDPNDPSWDTFTAESGAWVLTSTTQAGGWATARDMGDRRWFYHVIEFNLPAETEVGILIRVKSIYMSPKDFFIDAIWLEGITSRVYLPGQMSRLTDQRLVSWPQLLTDIPVQQRISP